MGDYDYRLVFINENGLPVYIEKPWFLGWGHQYWIFPSRVYIWDFTKRKNSDKTIAAPLFTAEILGKITGNMSTENAEKFMETLQKIQELPVKIYPVNSDERKAANAQMEILCNEIWETLA
jgi:hypothetical protein